MSKPYAGVIGDPIAHSKSPLIHGFWLKALGLEADYRACHVTPEGLADYVASRRDDPLWRGCNVTIPHKIAVIDHVADPGDVRTSIGAMNTIARDESGALFGTNTDAGGFYAPLGQSDFSGADIAVIGAGGAASEASSGATGVPGGRSTHRVKVAPCPSTLVAVRSPPIRRASSRLTVRPRPVPP